MKVLLTRTEAGGKQIGEVADLPDGEAMGIIGCGAGTVVDGSGATPVAAPVEPTPAPAIAPSNVCVVCGNTFKPSKLTDVEGIGLTCKSCAAPPVE